jgi:hypothetical protein|tara:strand:+ start:165 stop:380 length:216 start_codon:yes stop_codon:yes gene_type:complete
MSEYSGCDDFRPLMVSHKRAWFGEKLFVDMYGRAPNLSDVPMTYMTRSEAFKKRGLTRKEINKLWEKRHKE